MKKDVKELKDYIKELTESNKNIQKDFAQHGNSTQRTIGAMQRKLFEAQKANQDAFHARETLVQPEEQLDNNDRDMIDALVKNPGIGAVVLSIVLFVSGVQVGSNFKPGHEFSSEDDDSKDADSHVEAEVPACELPSFLQQPVDYLKDKLGRFLGALAPLMMLSVQFSYIFFIFDEAYASYSGGVCPAYNISEKTLVGPDDGTNSKIRILMGFIGLYFTARTVSQMFTFLRALTDRTVSNKDQNQKTWFHTVTGIIWSYITSCGKNNPPEKPSTNGLTISRIKGKECSKLGCCIQGFYYTSKQTDITKLIMSKIRAVETNQDTWKGQFLQAKAIMEYGLSTFLAGDSFAVSLHNRRLVVESQGETSSKSKDSKGFVLKCCCRCGMEQCNEQAVIPLQLGNSYVIFCRECFNLDGKRIFSSTKQQSGADPNKRLNAMRPNDLPPTCRFKGCDSQGACYLNTESELVNAFLRSGTDKISLPKRPDQGGGIGAHETPLLCCNSQKQDLEDTVEASIPRISLCLKHANEVEKFVFCEEWQLGSVDREILCKKHAVEELADEIAFRAEIMAMDDLGKRFGPVSKNARPLDDQIEELLRDISPVLPVNAVQEWLALCEDEVKKMSQKFMFSVSPLSDNKSNLMWNMWSWGKQDASLKIGREWFQDAETCNRITEHMMTAVFKSGPQKFGDTSGGVTTPKLGKEIKTKFNLKLEKANEKPKVWIPIYHYKERSLKYAAAIRWFAYDYDFKTLRPSNLGKRPDVPFKYERVCDIQGCNDTAHHGILILTSSGLEGQFGLRFCQKHAVYGATIAQHHNIEFPSLPCLKLGTVCRPVIANPEICEYGKCTDMAVHDKRFCQFHVLEYEEIAEKRKQWNKAIKKATVNLFVRSRSAVTAVAAAIERHNVDPFDESEVPSFSRDVEDPLKIMKKELVDDLRVGLTSKLKKIQKSFESYKKPDGKATDLLKNILELQQLKGTVSSTSKITIRAVYDAVQGLKSLRSEFTKLETEIKEFFAKFQNEMVNYDKLRKTLQECFDSINVAAEIVDFFNRYKSIEFAKLRKHQVSDKSDYQSTTNSEGGEGKKSPDTKAKKGPIGKNPLHDEKIDERTGIPTSIEAAVEKQSEKGLRFLVNFADKIDDSNDRPDAQQQSNQGKLVSDGKEFVENLKDQIFDDPQKMVENVESYLESKSKELIQNAEKKMESLIENKLIGSVSPYQGYCRAKR